jgi:hypothetical protein
VRVLFVIQSALPAWCTMSVGETTCERLGYVDTWLWAGLGRVTGDPTVGGVCEPGCCVGLFVVEVNSASVHLSVFYVP